MKRLTFLAIFVTVAFVALPVWGQTANPAKLKFNGLGLDSTYAQVVKALGKPESEESPKDEACIGGHEKSVKYPGLSLYFMDGDSKGGKTYEVKSFEITAPGYVASGVKIGDTEAVVKKKFGRKYTVDSNPETGEKTWLYSMNDRDGPGSTRFVFKNGKVIMIASDFQVC